MSGTGWVGLRKVLDGSGSPTGGSGLVGGPYRMSGMGRVVLLEVR